MMPDPPAADSALDDRATRLSDLAAAVALQEEQRIERVFVFDPLARRDMAFTLALVVKRVSPERLEMVAIGGRQGAGLSASPDFIRRAAFPEELLPEILAEFIDRCGVEGASYREVRMPPLNGADDPLDALAAILTPGAV